MRMGEARDRALVSGGTHQTAEAGPAEKVVRVSPILVLRQREVPVCGGTPPGGPHYGVLLRSPDSRPLTFTEGPLGLGAAALLPLAAAGQVASPLPAGRPLPVDVVMVQEVPGAAAQLPLRSVGLTRTWWLRGPESERGRSARPARPEPGHRPPVRPSRTQSPPDAAPPPITCQPPALIAL